MQIRPTRTVELDHRAFYLAASPSQELTVAADAQGRVSVIKASEEPSAVFSRPTQLRAAAIHPHLPLLAFVEDAEETTGRIVITGLDGSDLFVISPSQSVHTVPQWVRQGFGNCCFSANGEYLWCASALAENVVEVQVRDCATWQIYARIEIEDPFGGSSASFHATPDPDTFALWLAAGQDGQQIYWLTRNLEGIACKLEANLQDTYPPFFSPSGYHLLAASGGAVCRYTFPNVGMLGECLWEGAKEDSFGGYVCCLDERFALANSMNGRLLVLGVDAGFIKDEVIIENHEPMPAEKMYPVLRGDVELCADMSYFKQYGNEIISVHQRSPVNLEEWKDTLLYFPIDDIARATS